MKKILIALGLVVLVVVLAGVAWAAHELTSEDAPEQPQVATDAHEHIDPVATDVDVAATSNLAALLTMNPAAQATPYDQYAAIQDRLTGRLLKVAQNPPSDEMSKKTWPKEWNTWAATGDRLQAFVSRAPGSQPVAEDATEAVVTVDIDQRVMHPDGDMTPYRSQVGEVSMVKEDGMWKAENFQITHVNF